MGVQSSRVTRPSACTFFVSLRPHTQPCSPQTDGTCARAAQLPLTSPRKNCRQRSIQNQTDAPPRCLACQDISSMVREGCTMHKVRPRGYVFECAEFGSVPILLRTCSAASIVRAPAACLRLWAIRAGNRGRTVDASTLCSQARCQCHGAMHLLRSLHKIAAKADAHSSVSQGSRPRVSSYRRARMVLAVLTSRERHLRDQCSNQALRGI